MDQKATGFDEEVSRYRGEQEACCGSYEPHFHRSSEFDPPAAGPHPDILKFDTAIVFFFAVVVFALLATYKVTQDNRIALASEQTTSVFQDIAMSLRTLADRR